MLEAIRSFCILACMTFVVGAVTVCRAENAPLVLKLGVIQSLTGIAAPYGSNNLQAIQLAVGDFGATERTKIEPMIEDDQTDPKKTVAAYEKLKAAKVDAIIGSTWDFTSNTIVPLANRDKIVMMNSVMPESLQGPLYGGYIFSNGRSAARAVKPFEKFAKREGLKSVAIAVVNNSWGHVQLIAYKRMIESLGIKILDSVESSSFDANEWNSVVTRFNSKSPDGVILILNQTDIGIFARRAKTLRMQTKLFAVETAAEALVASADSADFEGLCMSYPLDDMKTLGGFAERFRAKYDEEPKSLAAAAYDSVGLILRAFQDGRARNLTLRDSLLQIKYHGVAGRQSFDNSESFAVGEFSLACIKQGKLAGE